MQATAVTVPQQLGTAQLAHQGFVADQAVHRFPQIGAAHHRITQYLIGAGLYLTAGDQPQAMIAAGPQDLQKNHAGLEQGHQVFRIRELLFTKGGTVQ